MVKFYTIGFTQKNLKQFTELLHSYDIKLVVDVRENPDMQLSAFARKRDLEYLLPEFLKIEYNHAEIFAPPKGYRKKFKGDWESYRAAYLQSIAKEQVVAVFRSLLEREGICFLCSEASPDFCHRRLLLEFMKTKLGLQCEIIHI